MSSVAGAWGPPVGTALVTRSPGLNSTMARRQPSSDLSICMSFILETSSVRTLFAGDSDGRENRECQATADEIHATRTRCVTLPRVPGDALGTGATQVNRCGSRSPEATV